jgi:hypothetical protein
VETASRLIVGRRRRGTWKDSKNLAQEIPRAGERIVDRARFGNHQNLCNFCLRQVG